MVGVAMLGPLPISVFTHHCSPATISAAGASFLCTVAFSGFRVFTPLVADQSAGGLTPSGMCPQSINDGNWCTYLPAPSLLGGDNPEALTTGVAKGNKAVEAGQSRAPTMTRGLSTHP